MARKPKTFAELVRHWRDARKLTRADAARLLAVPYLTLEDWEAGLRTPRALGLQLTTATLSYKARRCARRACKSCPVVPQFRRMAIVKKTSLVKARISTKTKRKIAQIARARGESGAVIVRE